MGGGGNLSGGAVRLRLSPRKWSEGRVRPKLSPPKLSRVFVRPKLPGDLFPGGGGSEGSDHIEDQGYSKSPGHSEGWGYSDGG